MKIAIGSDHRGIQQRGWVSAAIKSQGHSVSDQGTFCETSVDYPDLAALVALQVSSGKSDRGVLLCGTGIGVSIAANKIPGIRAAVCHDLHTAEMSRRHNDANVLCLSADSLDQTHVESIVSLWLATPFDGGRHQQRINKIALLESGRS
jgi:ribose 5-phosphate isomerase B